MSLPIILTSLLSAIGLPLSMSALSNAPVEGSPICQDTLPVLAAIHMGENLLQARRIEESTILLITSYEIVPQKDESENNTTRLWHFSSCHPLVNADHNSYIEIDRTHRLFLRSRASHYTTNEEK